MADDDPYAGLSFDTDYLLELDPEYSVISSHVFIKFPIDDEKTDWRRETHEWLISELCSEAASHRMPPPLRCCVLVDRWCFTPEAWKSPTIQKLFTAWSEQYGWKEYELSYIEKVHLNLELKRVDDPNEIFWDPVGPGVGKRMRLAS